MTKLEFCKAVLEKLGGNWPYAGALADAANQYPEKTIEQAVAKIRSTSAAKRRKAS